MSDQHQSPLSGFTKGSRPNVATLCKSLSPLSLASIIASPCLSQLGLRLCCS